MPWFLWVLVGLGCAIIFLVCCEQADRAHERWEEQERWRHPPDSEVKFDDDED